MLSLFKNYFFNFWIWWYLVKGRDILLRLTGAWSQMLALLNIVPMVKNLFVPLFQDTSWEGKLVAIPFRLVWAFFGSLIMVVYTAILLLALVFYLIMPLLPLAVVINTI